jgi:hypothetical protein
MTEKNMLGVKDWKENTDDLEHQLSEIKEKLHFSRTMKEREKLASLEAKLNSDSKRVKELRTLAYDTAMRNKEEISRLKLETARLINESVSIDNESMMLGFSLRAKQQEIADLKRQIEADKNVI